MKREAAGIRSIKRGMRGEKKEENVSFSMEENPQKDWQESKWFLLEGMSEKKGSRESEKRGGPR